MFAVALVAVILLPLVELYQRPNPESFVYAVFYELIVSPLVAWFWIRVSLREPERRRKAMRVLWFALSVVYATPFLAFLAFWLIAVLSPR
jgi:hypothetical protein